MFSNKFLNSKIFMDATAAGGGTADTIVKTPAEVFEEWLAAQPEETRKQYSEHTANLKSALDKERSAAKEASAKLKRLDELEAQETKRKEAELSENEKNQKLLAAAQQKTETSERELFSERMRNAVVEEATTLGFADPKDAIKMLDDLSVLSKDGKPDRESVKAELEKLAKSKAYLLKDGLQHPESPEINARDKGRSNVVAGQQEAINKKRKGYAPL